MRTNGYLVIDEIRVPGESTMEPAGGWSCVSITNGSNAPNNMDPF